MTYASQMQFEAFRRAVWAQKAKPNVVFDGKFWERAAQGSNKRTYCLQQGVRAKMCETTPFAWAPGTWQLRREWKLSVTSCESLERSK